MNTFSMTPKSFLLPKTDTDSCMPWRQSASSYTNPALYLLRFSLVNRKIIETSNTGWALLNSSGQGEVIVWALTLQGDPKKSLGITRGAASALGYSLTLLCHYPSSGGNFPMRVQSPWSSRFRTMTDTVPPALKQDRIGNVDTPWAVSMPDRGVRLLPDFSHLVSPGESRFCSKTCACMPL